MVCKFLAKTYTHNLQAGVVCKWTNDSQRFLLEHFDTIKNSPFYIYHSALPFCPSSSWLHKFYSTGLLPTVKVVKGLPNGWGKCSRTVLLGGYPLTLSCWNNTVAVGSAPGDIIIFDTITGSQTAVLSRHTDQVNCVTFSSDGTSLVSGSYDRTVKLWDVQTGGVVKTFSGHTDWVWSVSISADCTIIASGSRDCTICLWDIQREECQYVIQQQGSVYHVIFSPTNPQNLISISDEKLWYWDINGHQINPPSNGSHVTFSSDGIQFVSCGSDSVTVKKSDSGAIVAKLQVASDYYPSHCCFSLDSKLVAVSAYPTISARTTISACTTISIWDITGSNPHLVETLIGHTGTITSLAFSSSSTLISASYDKSVRFWQISSSADPAMADPGSTPTILPLISSISLKARDGVAISSNTDGVVETWNIPASLCKASSKSPAEDYKQGDVKMINSKLVFVWYGDGKINIWDPEKGNFLLQADLPGKPLFDLRISGDGSRIFSINGGLIQVWDIWTGEAIDEESFYDQAGSVTMDGLRVWLKSVFGSYYRWDFGIPGSPCIDLSIEAPETLHLSDTRLWDNMKWRIQDIVTGKVVFQLPQQYQNDVVEAQWNGQYLVISPVSEKELVLEFPHAFLQ